MIISINHSSPKTRYKTSECFKRISEVTCGRRALIEDQKILSSLFPHLSDSVIQVKENCYLTLINVSSVEEGSEYILNLNIIPSILDSIKNERIPFKILAMTVIRNCQKLHSGKVTILLTSYGFINQLLEYINVDDNKLQLLLWDNLKWMTYCAEGKKSAYEQNLLDCCFKKINYSNTELTNEIIQCLTNILVLTETKRQINSNNASQYTDILSRGLTHPDENIVLYSIKALSNAVIHPLVREILLDNQTIKNLNLLQNDMQNIDIKNSIKSLKDQIKWKP